MSGDVSPPAGTTPAGGVILDNLTGKLLTARKRVVEVGETLASIGPTGSGLTEAELDRLIKDLELLSLSAGLARARAERLRGPR